MTPFCRVDSLTYFIRGMASFLKLYFFLFFFFFFCKMSKCTSFSSL
ncbi:unnamed protein product, partial [Staurois parvus]